LAPLNFGAWLRRVERSPYADRLVLRGSLVTRRFFPSRVCEDVDHLLSGGSADELQRAATAVIAVADADPLEIVAREKLWPDTELPGHRVVFANGLQVDIGFGDPITVAPERVTIEGANVLAVRPESMIAWKMHGLVEQGPRGRWRPKDLHDLFLYASLDVDEAEVRKALEIAFSSRGTSLAQLEPMMTDATWGTTAEAAIAGSVFARPSPRPTSPTSSRRSARASTSDDGSLAQVFVARQLIDHERGDVGARDAAGHDFAVRRDAELSARGPIDERRRPHDHPFERALAHHFFLKLFVAKLRFQKERDEDHLLNDPEEWARLPLSAAVADGDGRERNQPLRSTSLHRFEDVARRDRHDVRRRLADPRARARSDRAQDRALSDHRAVDGLRLKDVAREDAKTLGLFQAEPFWISRERRDVVSLLERARHELAPGGSGRAEDEHLHRSPRNGVPISSPS
jgi:hypothetical protein